MDIRSKRRILIIDDEPDVLEILSYNFSKKGFKVFVERDGLSGLLSLKVTKPDLIILDIMMPFMDGLSMSRELKRNPVFYKIPVIFLSAATSKYLIDIANETGRHYLPKPVRFGILYRKVNEILQCQVNV